MKQDFFDLFNEISRKQDELQSQFVGRMIKTGVAAIHPDDGWVDREEKSVMFCYPDYISDIKVGDKVCLGDFEKHRIVVIKKVEKPRFIPQALTKYYF